MSQLGPWGDRPIAVAVSGGPDSLALAMLAWDWCRASRRAMMVLTVDHGLRAQSAFEARDVAALMGAREIPCRILTLPDLAPGTGIAARAREARYQALIAACRTAGVIDLLLGHHSRDQAETLLMRRAKASGPAGLAGMAGVHLRDGVRLVRPLLATPHDSLRAELRHRRIAWVEDPSNQDLRSSRVQFRAELTDPDTETLVATARDAGTARAGSEVSTAVWLARHATIRPEGFAYLDALACPPGALSALIQAIGGRAYPPSSASVAGLAGNLRPATLAGTRLMKARDAAGFLLLREQSAIAPPVPAEENILWDQRFRLIKRGRLPELATIGALGPDAARLRDYSHLPASILRTLPAIRAGAALLHVPFLSAGALNSDTGTVTCFNPPHPAAGALFRTIEG